MKEIIISFKADSDGHFDESAAKRAMLADAAFSTLWTIGQEIFRPARKHGYSCQKLQKLIEESGDVKDETYGELNRGTEIISLLEEKFYSILEENGINLGDLWS
jgi:hypothetical protein